MVLWRNSEEWGTCVDHSLSYICRALETRHFVVIHEFLNIDCPPLFVDLLKGDQRFYSAVDLWRISLSKCYVRPLSFLGETKGGNCLIDHPLFFQILHKGCALWVFVFVNHQLLVLRVDWEKLRAHAKNAIHLLHKAFLFFDWDQRKVLNTGHFSFVVKADLIFPDLTIEVSASVLFLDYFGWQGIPCSCQWKIVSSSFLTSLGA